MEPPHLHMNKEITDVLFNNEKFKFSSKFENIVHLEFLISYEKQI